MTAIAVKQVLPIRKVLKGNCSGKKPSNSWSQDVNWGRRFFSTNSVAQAFAERSNSSCEQVSLFLAFFVGCWYLKKRKPGIRKKEVI
jgi:hypothetical protein